MKHYRESSEGGHICEHASSNNTGNYFIYALAIDYIQGERR